MKKMRFFKLLVSLLLMPALLVQVHATQINQDGDPTVTAGAQSPDGNMPVFDSTKIMKSARSAVLYELTSDTLVYSLSPDKQTEPSSLTKIMTALLAVENGNLEDQITVSWQVMEQVPSNALVAGLKNGEEVTLEQLLYLMMVGSANDAACLIANHIGGSQIAFVDMMNQRAQELGCTGTSFRNAHGIHEEGHFSTARDLLKILRKAMEYPQFEKIFTTNRYTLDQTNMSEPRNYHTTNYMASDALTDDYLDRRVIGGRTGNTDAGRRNLAAVAEQDGSVYLTVVLEAESQYAENGVMIRQGAFEDTGLLLDLGFQQCTTVQVVYEGQILDQLTVTGGDSDVVISAAHTVSSVVPKSWDRSLLTTRIDLNVQTLTAPVQAGTYVGDYLVYYENRCIASVPLHTRHDVKTAPIPSTPGDQQGDTGFDPGALTTALLVLGVIFAVILVLLGGMFLLRWLRSMRGRNRKQKRRVDRRRSR